MLKDFLKISCQINNLSDFLMYLKNSFLKKSQKISILEKLEENIDISMADIDLTLEILKNEYLEQQRLFKAERESFEAKCIIRKKINEKRAEAKHRWKMIEIYFEEKRAKERDIEEAEELLYKIQNNYF